jgi:hypothetical protein
MPPLVRAVALALLILGFLAIGRAPWFGWLVVGVRAAGLLCAETAAKSPRGRAALAELALALVAWLGWLLGLVFSAPAWAVWWTFVMALGLALSAASRWSGSETA